LDGLGAQAVLREEAVRTGLEEAVL